MHHRPVYETQSRPGLFCHYVPSQEWKGSEVFSKTLDFCHQESFLALETIKKEL